MGQRIEVEADVIDDVAVFDTDRSVTGQDGVGFDRDGEPGEGFTGQLAGRLFEADAAVDRVFVASSQVTVRRSGGWDDQALGTAAAVIRDLFVFYPG